MIIGLTGYKGSGKSTVAKFIADEYGFKRINFKDGLVREMKEKFPNLLDEIAYSVSMLQQYETGIGESLTVSDLFELKPPLMRKLMQEYGTEVRRADYSDYWVNMWRKSASSKYVGSVVVDDVRFLNEAYAVRDMGGIIIRVVMQDQEQNDQHKSEREHLQIEPDFTITSIKGDHAHVYKQIASIIDTIKSNVD